MIAADRFAMINKLKKRISMMRIRKMVIMMMTGLVMALAIKDVDAATIKWQSYDQAISAAEQQKKKIFIIRVSMAVPAGARCVAGWKRLAKMPKGPSAPLQSTQAGVAAVNEWAAYPDQICGKYAAACPDRT